MTNEERVTSKLRQLGGRPLWKRDLCGSVACVLQMWQVGKGMFLLQVWPDGSIEVFVPVSPGVQMTTLLIAIDKYLEAVNAYREQ